MNKYEKWYSNLTQNAKQRTVNGLTEKHHILPRSLGGSDDKSNIVELTPREHFIAHWLLTKIYTSGKERYLVINALQGMKRENKNQQRYKTKITSRVYAHLKEEWSRLSSEKFKGEGNGFYGKHHTEETKERIRQANKGRVQPLEEKEKQRNAQKGKKRGEFSAEWKAKISAGVSGENNPRYGVEVSEETRKKIGDKIRGRKQTEEEKKRRADANRGTKKPRKVCEHCNKDVAVNVYARWHGPRCKTLKEQ